MKKAFIIILTLVLIGCVNNQKKENIEVPKKTDKTVLLQKKPRTLDEFKNNIFKFSKSNSSNLLSKPADVESIIPDNEEEMLYLYSLSYPEKDIELYDFINAEILKNAMDNLGNCFILYLNMSEFVDGELAESYFSDIDIVIDKNRLEFCKTYRLLSKGSKTRLQDIYVKYCD